MQQGNQMLLKYISPFYFMYFIWQFTAASSTKMQMCTFNWLSICWVDHDADFLLSVCSKWTLADSESSLRHNASKNTPLRHTDAGSDGVLCHTTLLLSYLCSTVFFNSLIRTTWMWCSDPRSLSLPLSVTYAHTQGSATTTSLTSQHSDSGLFWTSNSSCYFLLFFPGRSVLFFSFFFFF